MKLFEYQAKEAFRDKGLPTPKGVLVRGMDELDGAFAEVGFPCVLKSQVLRGGRGKAGLIKVVKDAESAKATAKALFESEHNVRMLLVEEAVDIDREIYLSIIQKNEEKESQVFVLVHLVIFPIYMCMMNHRHLPQDSVKCTVIRMSATIN